jgi:excinuclease ABC subunit B
MREYTARMRSASSDLDFETAAWLRDRLALLKDMELGLRPPARALLEAIQPRPRAAKWRGRPRDRRRVR